VQTFIYQFVLLTKINRLTLKCFEEKHLLLSGFMLEVVQITPANTACMNETLYGWTLNFHKVVRQHNLGAVEDFILPHSAVYLRIQKWKNYWNRSTFAKVIVKIKVAQFFLTHSVYVCGWLSELSIWRPCREREDGLWWPVHTHGNWTCVRRSRHTALWTRYIYHS